MIITIPKEIIALLTFPGIILHEISHRFMCDIFNVAVYKVSYFELEENSVGKVVHRKIYTYKESFCIAMAPLLINSLIAMILLMPNFAHIGSKDLLPPSSYIIIRLLFFITTWIGMSIGIHAMPSNHDVADLKNLARTRTSKFFTYILIGFIKIFNIQFIGFWLRFAYAAIISAIPFILLFR